MAPRDGFEPPARRLTVVCSTAELPGNMSITHLLVFNLIIIVFMTQNSNEKVDIFFFNYSLTDSYLNVVLLFNLLFGVAAGFLASVFIIIGNKSQIKSIQNKNRILTNELNDLRNVAIDEGIYDTVEDEDY